MALLTLALAFLAGLVVGVRVLAALYGPLDLWYTIRTAWPAVVRRIVVWVTVAAVLLALLRGAPRVAFVLGMAAHLMVHVATWFLIANTFPRKPAPTAIVE